MLTLKSALRQVRGTLHGGNCDDTWPFATINDNASPVRGCIVQRAVKALNPDEKVPGFGYNLLAEIASGYNGDSCNNTKILSPERKAILVQIEQCYDGIGDGYGKSYDERLLLLDKLIESL